MISREEAEAVIRKQLEAGWCLDSKEKYEAKGHYSTPDAHHYGRCELVDLLDAIYGGLLEKNGLSRLKG